jgi:hypothetical protein
MPMSYADSAISDAERASGSAARLSALAAILMQAKRARSFPSGRQFSEEDLSFRRTSGRAACSTYSSINFFQSDDSSANSWEYLSHLHQRYCPTRQREACAGRFA